MFENNISQNKIEPLADEAFHGVAGDLVRSIEPFTEASSAALLLQFLVMYGNAIGRSAHFRHEANRHYTNLNVVCVGPTSAARKGTSFNYVKEVFKRIDSEYIEFRLKGGMVSAEGVVHQIRDATPPKNENDKGDPGISDKRLLINESEFSGTLKVAAREGNTLSPLIRDLWDKEIIETLGKHSPERATNGHVSIIAHATPADIDRHLSKTDALNGLANRFLWCRVRRSKSLPDGGHFDIERRPELLDSIKKALDFGRGAGELKRDKQAKELWFEIYEDLTADRPGLFGAITARATPHVMRLALLYALLDCSREITLKHLRAALAVWDYCEESARAIFGTSTGSGLADEIHSRLIEAAAPVAKATIYKWAGNRPSHKVDQALALLQEHGMAHQIHSGTEERGAGRPAKLWKSGPQSLENIELIENIQPQLEDRIIYSINSINSQVHGG